MVTEKGQYKQGEKVHVNYAGLNFVGEVCGVSVSDLPVIGKHYIIQSLNGVISNAYPYICVSVPEIHLTRCVDVIDSEADKLIQ